MTEPNEKQSQDTNASTSTSTTQPTEQNEDQVVLTTAQYGALLDALNELEEAKKGRVGQEPKNVKELIDSTKGEQQLTPEVIDNLKPSEIIQLVMGSVQQSLVQPLLIRFEEMRIKQELKDIKATEEGKDFDEYKDEVFQIASANTSLSLSDAFRLAKAKHPKSADPNARREKDRDLLRTLPQRKPFGEKPGNSSAATRPTAPENRSDAAREALEEMRKEGKI